MNYFTELMKVKDEEVFGLWQYIQKLYWDGGLAQKELAELLNVHRRTIGRWMKKLNIDARYSYKKANSSKVQLKCSYCGKSFSRYPSKVNPDNNYCSKVCADKAVNKKISLDCDYCGKSIMQRRSRVQRHTYHFCSNSCQGKYFTGMEYPESAKRKISEANTGKERSEEVRLAKSKQTSKYLANHGFSDRGKYKSQVTNIVEYYDSSWELQRFKELDELGRRWTKKHGITIEYKDEQDILRHYVPDILIEGHIIEEIKPEEMCKLSRNQCKLAALKEYAHQEDYEYRILTDNHFV